MKRLQKTKSLCSDFEVDKVTDMKKRYAITTRDLWAMPGGYLPPGTLVYIVDEGHLKTLDDRSIPVYWGIGTQIETIKLIKSERYVRLLFE